MRKSKYTEEQIIGFLKQAEAGMPVKDLCRKCGFSEAGDGCTSHQRNTHSTESRVVRYRWHPWFDQEVWIHRTNPPARCCRWHDAG